MIAAGTPLPLLGTMAGFRRFSVPEYHKLIEIGMLTEEDHLELLEGYLVHKMSRNPPQDGTIQLLQQALLAVLPSGWCVRVQSAVTLEDSEPEPDLAVVRGHARSYLTQHPQQDEIGLIIEVADSTLAGDRADKGRIYARAGLACYWIVNLPDQHIEVYDQPTGPVAAPAYTRQSIYQRSDALPLLLAGKAAASLLVQDLLP